MQICLCMIVKDESAVIARCLQSVRGLIDYWVICDTGSSDSTEAIIRQELSEIPGSLHSSKWTNFGINRTELLQFAHGRGDYLLLLDADMTVSFDRSTLGNLTADSYLLRHNEPVEYWIKRLVKSNLPWRYEGSTHEVLVCDIPDVSQKLESIVVHHHGDGGSRQDKYERDRVLLISDLEESPSNPRTVFYLAQTYRDLGRRVEALDLYARRASMGGWDEEVFYSKFQVGWLRAEAGDWPRAMTELVAAWEFRPSRLEPVYELASRLRERGEYHTAHLFARYGIDRPRPADTLFVWRWVYDWGLLFEYSITSYWTGDSRKALAACRRLLAISDLPDNFREQTEANMEYCRESIANLSKGRPVRGAAGRGGMKTRRKRPH